MACRNRAIFRKTIQNMYKYLNGNYPHIFTCASNKRKSHNLERNVITKSISRHCAILQKHLKYGLGQAICFFFLNCWFLIAMISSS